MPSSQLTREAAVQYIHRKKAGEFLKPEEEIIERETRSSHTWLSVQAWEKESEQELKAKKEIRKRRADERELYRFYHDAMTALPQRRTAGVSQLVSGEGHERHIWGEITKQCEEEVQRLTEISGHGDEDDPEAHHRCCAAVLSNTD